MINILPAVTHVLPRLRPPLQRPRPAQRTARLGNICHYCSAVGNRVSYAINPGAGVQTDVYTYPATSNKLGSISLGAGGSRAFTYDAAGNVTYDNRAAGGYGYTYNAAGRMSEFTISGVLKASYKYDFAGRQAIRTLAGGVTIHSVFDSAGNRIAEYNEATGALIREYVWMGGAPLAVIEGGVTTFIRADHIGRPVFGTNTAGTKVWTAAYHPALAGVLGRSGGKQSTGLFVSSPSPLRRRQNHHRHRHQPALPRPMVPIRIRLAPELEARLRSNTLRITLRRPEQLPQKFATLAPASSAPR